MGFWDGTPDSAAAETTIAIKVCDGEKPNQTIVVGVDRDDEVPADDIEIVLNDNGCGETEYLVPSGPSSIEFSTTGHPSHVMVVT